MQLSLPGLRTTASRRAADPERTGGRKTFAMVALTAAAVAVIGTASFAGGLFTGDDGGDESTSDLNSGLSTASVEPEPSASASKPASASTSPSTSASARKPATSGPPSASAKPAAPSRPPANAPEPDVTASTKEETAPGLRRGDSGPQVEELQRRLSEVWLYNGGYDGQYSDGVEAAVRIYQSYKSIEGDPSGVYGPNTRRALEAETSGEGREQGEGGGGTGGGGPGRDRD